MPICSAITTFLRINDSLVCPFEQSFRSKQILSDRGWSLSAGHRGRSREHVGRTAPSRDSFFSFLCSFWQKLCQITGLFTRPGKTFQLLSSGSAAWRILGKSKRIASGETTVIFGLFSLSSTFILFKNFVVERCFLSLPYVGFFWNYFLAHAFIMLYLERELVHHDFDLIWIDACQFACVGFRQYCQFCAFWKTWM